ncbi:MAG: response regulator transcription factor [Phycisphaeraceae bacterium]
MDDHVLVREALSERLGRETDLQMVGAAADADDALKLAAADRPDVVLMDIDMPGLVCFEAAATMMAQYPGIQIVFLSAFFHDRYIEQVLRIKARGYISKREPIEAVIQAIRKVAAGGVYFSPEIRTRLVIDHEAVRLEGANVTRFSTLTPRELEVLRYVARGMAKKEIAGLMAISVKTVENHCGNLMNKLEMHDRVALARFAFREGLAEP